MQQSHQILLNPRFSGSSIGFENPLTTTGGYLVHVQEVNGGGIVNEYNVRAFLANKNNANIVSTFKSYLENGTSNSQYEEIYYNDKKLAEVFRVFYQTAVLQNIPTTNAVILKNLTGTTQITSFNNNFSYNNSIGVEKPMDYIPQEIFNLYRMDNPEIKTVVFTDKQSYYVPVYLNRRSEPISLQVAEGNIDSLISDDSIYAQGFVDLNLGDDPNDFWSDEAIENANSGVGLDSTDGQTGGGEDIPDDTGNTGSGNPAGEDDPEPTDPGDVCSEFILPITASDISYLGSTAWSNTNNLLSTSAVASQQLNQGESSDSLRTMTLRRFGNNLSIPSNATIKGIQVEIKREGGKTVAPFDDLVADRFVQLATEAGDPSSWSPDNKAKVNDGYSTDSSGYIAETVTYGGETDLWGYQSISPATINNSQFGVIYHWQPLGGQSAPSDLLVYLHYIKLKVCYNVPSNQCTFPEMPATASNILYPTDTANNAYQWLNYNNLLTESAAAIQELPSGENAEALPSLAAFDYSSNLNIPVGATINGIEVQIRKKTTTGNDLIVDDEVRLTTSWTDPTTYSQNKASSTLLTTDYVTYTYGGDNDLWGYQSINRNAVMGSAFGVIYRWKPVESGPASMLYNTRVAFIKVKVCYTTSDGTQETTETTYTYDTNQSENTLIVNI